MQGYLQKIEFADGVNVEENQLLFVIDPRPFQAALDQAKADLQSKQATVTQQESVTSGRWRGSPLGRPRKSRPTSTGATGSSPRRTSFNQKRICDRPS